MSERSVNHPLLGGDPFRQWVTILISLTILLVALSSVLQADAANRADRAAHDAQLYAIQAIGHRARGELQVDYAYADVFRWWADADDLVAMAQSSGDADAASRYRAARDRVARLSALVSSKRYFDPARSALPDVAAFEADVYLVETAALIERFSDASALNQAWLAKSSAYRAQLILLAAAISVYALAMTVGGKVKWVLVGVGGAIGCAVIVWTIVLLLTRTAGLPERAILAYAQGIKRVYQRDYAGAIEAFDQAVLVAPGYANAHYARGNAAYGAGDWEGALAGYQEAVEAGRADVSVLWNLGWTRYVLGQPQDAVRALEQALALDANRIGLYFDLGIAYLAAGQPGEAQSAYDAGIELAVDLAQAAQKAGQEPPESLWLHLDAAAIDVEHFLRCLSTQVCIESPPYSAISFITKDEFSMQSAQDFRLALKNAAVALEYSGQLGPEQVAATVGPLKFAQGVYDDWGELVDYAAFGDQGGAEVEVRVAQSSITETGELFVLFDYSRMSNGQWVVLKVYVDDQEAPELRLAQPWSMGSNGQAALSLFPSGYSSPAPARYRVEVYVDSCLVQTGGFTVEDR